MCPMDSTKALFDEVFKSLIIKLHELRVRPEQPNRGRVGGGGLKMNPGKGSTSCEQSRVNVCWQGMREKRSEVPPR